MTADPDEVEELRAEIEHLRSLVGPDERTHAELREDARGARCAARAAEADAGVLRGTIAEMQVQLGRARQDQERYQRSITMLRAGLGWFASTARRVSRRVRRGR